jgi:hypothetical protein
MFVLTESGDEMETRFGRVVVGQCPPFSGIDLAPKRIANTKDR